MTETYSRTAKKRTSLWFLLGALLLCCVAVIAFPILIIRPFVRQSALPLSLALIVMRWAAWFTVLAFVTGVLLVVRSWARGGERLAAFKNAVLLVVVGGLGFCVWASRINIYERIFAPAETVQFISADQANLRPDDMVIAVSINNTNRAYPILQMAYHHVINDVAGGVPVVSTY